MTVHPLINETGQPIPTEAINCFFRIIERGHSDKKMAEQLKETREKIYQLENGRPLQMTESPFDGS